MGVKNDPSKLIRWRRCFINNRYNGTMTSSVIVIHASRISGAEIFLTEETASHRVTYSARDRNMCVYLYLQTQGFHVRVVAREGGGDRRHEAEPWGISVELRVIYSHVELHRRCERLLKLRHHSGRLIASSSRISWRVRTRNARSQLGVAVTFQNASRSGRAICRGVLSSANRS